MDTQPILDLIREEARQAAEKLRQEAEDQAMNILEETGLRISRLEEETIRAAREEGERLRERMLRMAGLESHREALGMKHTLIGEAFGLALSRLRELPADRVEAFLLRVVPSGAQGDETLVAGAINRAFYTPGFIDRLNEALNREGKPGKLKDSRQEMPDVCGLVLRGEGSETHCTFEALLETRHEDLESIAAAVLFPAET